MEVRSCKIKTLWQSVCLKTSPGAFGRYIKLPLLQVLRYSKISYTTCRMLYKMKRVLKKHLEITLHFYPLITKRENSVYLYVSRY